MANFFLAWQKTSKNEGGYVNSSADKGKETYRGISIVFCPDWDGWDAVHKAVAAIGLTDTSDAGKAIYAKIDKILAVNPAVDDSVQRFYKSRYWDTIDLDHESDQLIAEQVFDTAVNMGVGTAKKFFKEAKNA